MKKVSMLLILFLMAIGVTLTGCTSNNTNDKTNSENKKLAVYSSFYAMYDFAKKIGGDKITITNLVPAGTEPHDWEPSTKDINNLEKADVLIYNGAGMEHWIKKVVGTLENKKLVTVEASQGINLIEGHEEEEEKEKDAEESKYDPHVWMNPQNAKKEMENIKNALVKADESNKKYYEDNYNKYAKQIDELDKEFKDAISNIKNKDIIVAHQAFGYLCKQYGLNQVSIEGLSADSEPDPTRMKEIIKFAEEHKVKTIFFEELVSPKVSETIAKEVGAKTDMLNPLEGLSDKEQAEGKDYFTVMKRNLESLKAALG
ncbi:metal ABC transporter substrate-binding protein [Inconstantimicrobium mannanitabidum]|uniref:ABC transporter substrate-binding protein n=1 Tax=Inconstantimicrobium mannanitabidum TaxID=1604901 RepID=A0ACB5RFL6_9CLOT|nr:metal ABC transporter substrate-binding protein [Clostridium sp. TW13]GKX67885.1 ABC transporter substrate-binding protein [Clostridium sp. TW13]